MTSGFEPFRWWMMDEAFRVLPAPPPPDWDGWEARYDNDCERGKRTTRLSPLCAEMVRALENRFLWFDLLGYPLDVDPHHHGGGLHVTAPGGHLSCHLDYDQHPLIPDRRRALNIVAFCHPKWERQWGGELYLADPGGQPIQVFEPCPGRVVAFECSDLSYHGVFPTAADAGERVSVAAYLLCDRELRRECDRPFTRRRALFMPNRAVARPA